MEKFFSPQEIAIQLQISKGTVWRWIRKGKLPSHKMGEGAGTRYRVAEGDLTKFVKDIKPFLPNDRK